MQNKQILREHSPHQNTKIDGSQIELFQGLPRHVQDTFLQHAKEAEYKKGDLLARENDIIENIIVILKGRVKTSRIDANGEEYIFDILHDQQSIWHDMFLQDNRYYYDITALTDVHVCCISRQDFVDVLKTYPESCLTLISMVSTELADAKEKGILLSIRNPMERLASFLLVKDHTCTNHLIQLKLEDIAASICLRPETISRHLRKFEKDGFIERNGQGKIRVIDHGGLREISGT